MVTKYYAVVFGIRPGIYTDWSIAESMVKNFPGAIFKIFYTRADAETFMANSTLIPKKQDFLIESTSATLPKTLPLIDKTIIYTDGNCARGECGFGIVILTKHKDKMVAYGKIPNGVLMEKPSINKAEFYAIYVALSLVQGNIILYSNSQYATDFFTSYMHNKIQDVCNKTKLALHDTFHSTNIVRTSGSQEYKSNSVKNNGIKKSQEYLDNIELWNIIESIYPLLNGRNIVFQYIERNNIPEYQPNLKYILGEKQYSPFIDSSYEVKHHISKVDDKEFSKIVNESSDDSNNELNNKLNKEANVLAIQSCFINDNLIVLKNGQPINI